MPWTAKPTGFPLQAQALEAALKNAPPGYPKFALIRPHLSGSAGVWITTDQRFVFRRYGTRWKMKVAAKADALANDLWSATAKPTKARDSLTACLLDLGHAAGLLNAGKA